MGRNGYRLVNLVVRMPNVAVLLIYSKI